jgi:uncharacterized protein
LILSIDVTTLILVAVVMAAAGAVSGFLAGLFGIGGGAILVPILNEAFGFVGVDPSVRAHLAVGTTFAIIIPTALTSFRAHRKRGSPDIAMLKRWLIPVPLGVMVASYFVSFASGDVLKGVFGVVAVAIALKMLFNRDSWSLGKDLPREPWRSLTGFVISFISTFMGIGGGNLNNLFMTSFGRSMHQAIGTSAGLGILIAVPGLLGYVWSGWARPELPTLTVGYVSLIAVALVVPLSIALAPLGAKVAHGLSKRQLEICFGLFLLATAIRFFWSIIF